MTPSSCSKDEAVVAGRKLDLDDNIDGASASNMSPSGKKVHRLTMSLRFPFDVEILRSRPLF